MITLNEIAVKTHEIAKKKRGHETDFPYGTSYWHDFELRIAVNGIAIEYKSKLVFKHIVETSEGTAWYNNDCTSTIKLESYGESDEWRELFMGLDWTRNDHDRPTGRD